MSRRCRGCSGYAPTCATAGSPVVEHRSEPLTDLIGNLAHDLSAQPDEVVESQEIVDVLQRESTPCPKQQTAIILYYLHGYSLAEAAEIAGCHVGTMKSRIHYALRALRVLLPVARRTPIPGHGRLASSVEALTDELRHRPRSHRVLPLW